MATFYAKSKLSVATPKGRVDVEKGGKLPDDALDVGVLAQLGLITGQAQGGPSTDAPQVVDTSKPPAKSASRPTWEAYVVAAGLATKEQVTAAGTKDDVIAFTVSDPPRPPAGGSTPPAPPAGGGSGSEGGAGGSDSSTPPAGDQS